MPRDRRRRRVWRWRIEIQMAMKHRYNKRGFAQGGPASDKPVDRLDLKAPVRTGVAAMLLFALTAVGATATIPIGQSIAIVDLDPVTPQAVVLRHAKGGVVGQVHVAAGAAVKAGELLVSLETRELDEQISALKLQAEAATMKLAGVRKEAQLVAAAGEQTPQTAARVRALEKQLAEIEKETIGLQVRIALAEEDVIRSEIRAPAAGRVTGLAEIKAGMPLAANTAVAELAPTAERVSLRGKLRDTASLDLRTGEIAKVWISPPRGGRAHPFDAQIASISADAKSSTDRMVQIDLVASRTEIARRLAIEPGMSADLRLARNQRTLLDQLRPSGPRSLASSTPSDAVRSIAP
jgi:multidrug resistance efflux pump